MDSLEAAPDRQNRRPLDFEKLVRRYVTPAIGVGVEGATGGLQVGVSSGVSWFCNSAQIPARQLVPKHEKKPVRTQTFATTKQVTAIQRKLLKTD